MRKIWLALLAPVCLLVSCDSHRVRGNGQIASETRSVNTATRINVSGSFDVELTQGSETSLRVEADENLLGYIITREENGILYIETKRHTSFTTEHNMTVYITTPRVESFRLAGSGNVNGKNKLTGAEKLTLKIAGSGDINLDVNAPEISAEIAGNGNMNLKGETRRQVIKIAGNGDYNAEELKAEETKVTIAGAGNLHVFADALLDVSIAGSGSVFYKGNAAVKQHVVGSGEIRKIE